MAEPTPDDVRTAPFQIPGFVAGGLPPMSYGRVADEAAPETDEQRRKRLQKKQDDIVERQLEITEEMYKTLPEAQREAEAQRRAAAGAAGARQRETERVVNQPLPDLYKPNYEKLPQAPKPNYREPLDAIGNPLAILARVAGLFTRQSATTAFNAMGAAMAAQQKGDQVAFANATTAFESSMREVVAHNNEEHRAYTDAWNDRKSTWDERMAKLQMLSTKYGNGSVGTSVAQGKFDLLNKQLQILEAQGKVVKDLLPKATAGLTFEQRLLLKHEEEQKQNRQAEQRQRDRLENKGTLTGGQRATEQHKESMMEESLTALDRALGVLNKYPGAAGVVGKIMRGEEIASNIFGGSETDREQFRRDIRLVQLAFPRIINAGGRALAADSAKVDEIVAGLQAGDTTANSRRALEEVRDMYLRLLKTQKEILGQNTPALAVPQKPASINWDDVAPEVK